MKATVSTAKQYYLCLLQHEELHAAGLPIIPHGQHDQLYADILEHKFSGVSDLTRKAADMANRGLLPSLDVEPLGLAPARRRKSKIKSKPTSLPRPAVGNGDTGLDDFDEELMNELFANFDDDVSDVSDFTLDSDTREEEVSDDGYPPNIGGVDRVLWEHGEPQTTDGSTLSRPRMPPPSWPQSAADDLKPV